MNNPAIWSTPAADAVITNGGRSFVDGDTVSIPFTFQRTVTKVRYIKGTVPYGASAAASGITGTLASKNPPENTPPRDYTLTVRAYAAATQAELDAGYDAEVYEDRTFTIVGGLWFTPEGGDLTNNGSPYIRGDSLTIPFTFDSGRTLTGLTQIGGELPPGVGFSITNKRLTGTVAALPKGVSEYPILFRATVDDGNGGTHFQDRAFKIKVNPLDEQHGWDTAWLSNLTTSTSNGNTVYDLGTVYRGSSVEIQLQILNPDDDFLEFKAAGYIHNSGTWFEGLPEGLSIDSFGRIVGVPVIADNAPGDYYFRVYAREPSGTEGSPRTSELVFRLSLAPEIRLDQTLNDGVRWVTPAGSLGSTHEAYPSHFAVEAVPQYQVGNLTNEYQTIRYRLVGNRPLPAGAFLDQWTGNITGRMPYVDSDTTYTFKIRARVVFVNRNTGAIRSSATYSDRDFSITVVNIHAASGTANVYVSVPPLERTEIVKWVYGNKAEYHDSHPQAPSVLTVLGQDVLFRPQDDAWGKVEDLRVLLLGGMRTTTPAEFFAELNDYHRPTEVLIGDVRWAKGYDPSGNYVYDMVYLTIDDPMSGAGGFSNGGLESVLPIPHSHAVPEMNLPANSDRYHPTSLRNMRMDLKSVGTRKAWPGGNELAAERGIGLSGKESLPLWMDCEQTPGLPSSRIGYIPAIELAYLKPGQGAQAVKSLVLAGFEQAVSGRVIKIDRYLLISEGFISLTFDVDGTDITTFDGPDAAQPTPSFTTFDQTIAPVGKYYKFPPGDRTS